LGIKTYFVVQKLICGCSEDDDVTFKGQE